MCANHIITDRFFHPWHSVPLGDNVPESVNSFIEIKSGSKAKYELDKQTGFLRLDRVLDSHLHYPFHYGFIPQTLCDDHDPLDIVLLCSEPLLPQSIVEARIVGAMRMVDGGEQDDKLIGITCNDPLLKSIEKLSDIQSEILETIKYFFENYKAKEKKTVLIEDFVGKKEAQKILTDSIELYKKTYKK